MRRSLAGRLAVLGALYLVQGLPYGIQTGALQLILRRQGVSLSEIGFAGALFLPWLLKLIPAPFVDAYFIPALGRRRTWILPLQLGMVGCALVAATSDIEQNLSLLYVVLLLMNVCAALMDVAVDGLAVDLLGEHELGPGNAAQVVGYKLGSVLTGGLLVWLSAQLGGWSALFWSIVGIVGVVFLITLWFREPDVANDAEAVGLVDVARVLAKTVSRPGMRWVLLFIATYKLGESLADAMFKPFLVDHGYTDAQIGLWVGTWGKVASVLGSLAGGLLAARIPIVRAVGITAALRALPIVAQWALAVVGPTDETVIAVTCTEHFFGGAITTAMFAFMMSRVDRRIGGTHFTAFATVEVLGKMPAGLLSGVIAEQLGYAGTFGAGAVLSLVFLFLLVPLHRTSAPATLPAEEGA